MSEFVCDIIQHHNSVGICNIFTCGHVTLGYIEVTVCLMDDYKEWLTPWMITDEQESLPNYIARTVTYICVTFYVKQQHKICKATTKQYFGYSSGK